VRALVVEDVDKVVEADLLLNQLASYKPSITKHSFHGIASPKKGEKRNLCVRYDVTYVSGRSYQEKTVGTDFLTRHKPRPYGGNRQRHL
jgi:hypothetical protein